MRVLNTFQKFLFFSIGIAVFVFLYKIGETINHALWLKETKLTKKTR